MTFSIKRDLETVKDGGFFCEACIVGKPSGEQSPDPRYCLGCFDLLTEEAKYLGNQRRPGWVPVTATGHRQDKDKALLASKEVVPKIAYKGKIPRGIMAQPLNALPELPKPSRGRPRIVGTVSRRTMYRRKKELQGALL